MRSINQSHWITKPYLYALLTTLLVAATCLLPARGSATSADSVAQLVKDINTRTHSSSPQTVGTLGNSLYFVTGSENRERLWRSDGTAAGTMPIARGFDNCGWAHVRERGFFCAGAGLWQTDGTPAGTTLLKNHSSAPEQITAIGDSIFFILRTNSGSQLWKSDGSAAGTLLINFVPWPISDLVDVGGSAFFVAQTIVAGKLEFELWKSDGTPAGTLLVKTIPPLPTSGAAGAQADVGPAAPDPPEQNVELENVNGTLFFVVRWGNVLNYGLWKSDGTPNGTVLVKDINRNGLIVTVHTYPNLMLYSANAA
jgi:ELWxxDGT repeat protein